MNRNFTKFAFTKSVKDVQERHGSRSAYARMEASGDRYVLTGKEKGFISSRDSFYLATVGENGWPYAQFRGGPIGFLKVIERLIVFNVQAYDWNCQQHITPRYTAADFRRGRIEL